jgi:hypothetical protein
MSNKNRVELDPEMLDLVAGGSIGFNPDGSGTYTMYCEYSGAAFYGVELSQIIQIAQYGANIPDGPDGEQQIIGWAQSMGFI